MEKSYFKMLASDSSLLNTYLIFDNLNDIQATSVFFREAFLRVWFSLKAE